MFFLLKTLDKCAHCVYDIYKKCREISEEKLKNAALVLAIIREILAIIREIIK